MEISYNTPDAEDKANQYRTLLPKINEHIERQVQRLLLDSNLKLSEFNLKLDAIQEHVYETYSMFLKHPYSTHKLLWLVSMRSLLGEITRFILYFEENLANFADDESLCNMIDVIDKKINKLLSDFGRLHNEFAAILDICDYLSENLAEYYLEVLDMSMKFVIYDLVNLSPLASIQKSIVSYLQLIGKTKHKYDKNRMLSRFFPYIASFLKAAYETGQSNLILPLLEQKLISPSLALTLIQKSTVNFVDLLAFLRYTAFNLVSLSLSKPDVIEEHHNAAANTYFKILLNLPNLSTSHYELLYMGKKAPPAEFGTYEFQLKAETSRSTNVEESIISLLDRQEISLIFLINYMLSLISLRQVVEPSRYFSSEISFLSASLAYTLSTEIDRSASQSSHSSTASFAQLKWVEFQKRLDAIQQERRQIKMKSLSSLLRYGSYKEKVTLIAQVIDALENLNTDSIRIILDAITLPDMASGKLFYIRALQTISRLYFLLTLKFTSIDSGLNQIPASQIKEFLRADVPLERIVLVKRLLEYSYLHGDTGEPVVQFRLTKENVSSAELIEKQVAIIKTMKQLLQIHDTLQGI